MGIRNAMWPYAVGSVVWLIKVLMRTYSIRRFSISLERNRTLMNFERKQHADD